jgi:hypothetical protein
MPNIDSLLSSKGISKVSLSRSQITAMKREISHHGSEGYAEMMRVKRHPMANALLRSGIISGTPALYWFRVIFGWLTLLYILIVPLYLLFTTRWYWAVAAAALYFLVFNPIETQINLELGARLMVFYNQLDLESEN